MYLVCGEALFDLFLRDSDSPASLALDARAGGSPYNVAVGVARRGGRSALLASLSTDLLGERLRAALEAEGVDGRYLVRSGRPTTLSLVDLSTEAHPRYAFHGEGAADTALTEADLPDIGPEICGLHFGSYSIAVAPAADALHALAARETHRFISLDPNVRAAIQPDIAIWRRRLDALLAHATLVKASAEDLSILYPGAARDDVAERWLGVGAHLVVITDGGAAVAAYSARHRAAVAPPSCAVIDTVGAGDAFQATLLTELAALGPPLEVVGRLDAPALERLLRSASRIASATCARRGADIPRAGDAMDL